MAIEYMDSATAAELGWNRGNSANADWVNKEADPEGDYQPDLDPPRIPDYANLKKHKHYRQYFRTYKFRPFPAWVYHPTKDPVIVKSKEEALALGPEWSPTPFEITHNMVGKSLPAKTQQEQLNENIRTLVAAQTGGKGAIDPQIIATIIAGVMQAMNGQTTSALATKPSDGDKVDGRPELELPAVLDRRPKK